jgi:hypothetical protein
MVAQLLREDDIRQYPLLSPTILPRASHAPSRKRGHGYERTLFLNASALRVQWLWPELWR